MPDQITLSVDAMGGDSAPHLVVAGIHHAMRDLPHVRYMLFGDQARIEPLFSAYPKVRDVVTIHHTEDAVSNDEKPSVALRAGRNSSMRLAINAVGDGEAHGVVSAGNTGALMAMAKFVLKTLPGISRPAIATYFPTQRSESVMLDLGANIQCSAENLVQFAVMGEVFARKVLHLEQPSIGLLNVGTEDMKGNESVREAAAVLQDSPLPIKFYGFIEGDDIGAGTVDVIVTDGFTGNVALKTAEGVSKLFSNSLKKYLLESLLGKIGALIARPAINRFRDRFDPRHYNGAMFLGLNGVCVKSHGGTDELGFANALKVAAELVKDRVVQGIGDDYAHVSKTLEAHKTAMAEAAAADAAQKIGAE